MDDYEYDVFISYRRAGGAQKWVDKHFAPTLRDCLAYELPAPPRVFFDAQLEEGTTWPPELGHKLARSRMLVSLWSKNYLNSEWCAMELAHMRAREAEAGFRTAENPSGLIAICVIHDGEQILPELQSIQSFEIRDYFNTRMREDSEAAERLEAVLRQKAPAIARIIERAPAYRPSWATTAAETFYAAFKTQAAPSQTDLVSFTRPLR
ncbi:MAG TPA: TIR domain-containing protein [Kofleriaceae bacterium]|nr:TIR domain-containing protein [Kofleriaceae bacterium]